MDNSEESGDYFVSMTDMMVGVLFVFIIIVSYFVLELQKSLDKVAKKEEVVLLSTHEKVVKDFELEVITLEKTEKEQAVVIDEQVVEIQKKIVVIDQQVVEIEKKAAVIDEKIFVIKKKTVVIDEQQIAINMKEIVITKLEEEIEKLRRNSWQIYAAAANNKRSEIIQAISAVLVKEGIEFKADPKVGVIRLEGDGLFNTGSSNLKARKGAVNRISILAKALYENLECYSLHKENENLKLPKGFNSCNPEHVFIEAVYVEGHSDSDGFTGKLRDGSRNNLELSARRATNTYAQMTVAQHLLPAIVNPLGQQALSTAAYGAQRPVVDNSNNLNKSLNRRIDLRFVMYLPESDEARRKLQREVGKLL